MPDLPELLAKIDALKAELDALRPLDRELEERVQQKFRLWWTYHSNAIEGNKLTQGETEMFLMEGLTAKGKPLKDHLDLRGHSNAVNFLLGFIRDKEILTEAAIRKLHEVLLVEAYQVPAITADGHTMTRTVALGEYKSQPNHVRTPTGEIHYYASPVETPAKMQKLVDWQRAESLGGETHPVKISALFHHEFTAIHPFDDGNGRMARLLMNLLLLQAGYPPVVIRIGERDDYLTVLRQADRGETEGFLVFVAARVVESLELYLRAANGEEIKEPTDLDKEIALLKLDLQHIEEPQPISQEAQMRIFEKSLEPLFVEISKGLVALADLFSGGYVKFSGDYGSESISKGFNESASLDVASTIFVPQESWDGKNVINNFQLVFELKGFKKARFDAFDLSTSFAIRFEPLKYVFEAPHLMPPQKIECFYQEQISEEELKKIAQGVTRFFLEAIKKKTAARN